MLGLIKALLCPFPYGMSSKSLLMSNSLGNGIFPSKLYINERITSHSFFQKEKICSPLTNVVQLVGCCPENQKVTGWIPCQGTCLGCEFSPWWEYERQPIDVSLPLFLPPFPLSKRNK